MNFFPDRSDAEHSDRDICPRLQKSPLFLHRYLPWFPIRRDLQTLSVNDEIYFDICTAGNGPTGADIFAAAQQ